MMRGMRQYCTPDPGGCRPKVGAHVCACVCVCAPACLRTQLIQRAGWATSRCASELCSAALGMAQAGAGFGRARCAHVGKSAMLGKSAVEKSAMEKRPLSWDSVNLLLCEDISCWGVGESGRAVTAG